MCLWWLPSELKIFALIFHPAMPWSEPLRTGRTFCLNLTGRISYIWTANFSSSAAWTILKNIILIKYDFLLPLYLPTILKDPIYVINIPRFSSPHYFHNLSSKCIFFRLSNHFSIHLLSSNWTLSDRDYFSWSSQSMMDKIYLFNFYWFFSFGWLDQCIIF